MHSTISINDDLWQRLIELSDGAVALCYQCGACTAICPWGAVRKEPFSVRTTIRKAQLGLLDEDPDLWLCTTCGQCQVTCPRGVDIPQVIRALRAIAWEARAVEPGLPSLLLSIFWNDNPWSQPPSQRPSWAKGLSLPSFNPDEHEILLYVGCTSSFDPRAQRIARALVKLLEAAGVKFGYLGEDEPCCGESALSVGHHQYFEEIAYNTLSVFRDRGVTDLITISPHCYDVMRNYYPKPGILEDDVPASAQSGNLHGITPYHYTQYLAQLIETERLVFNHSPKDSAGVHSGKESYIITTFQDPCYLGRHNQEYEAPRHVMKSIPGIKLIEMPHSYQDGLCCGGGGGRMWLETAPGQRFADLRVLEAKQTGAKRLITACPFCVVCLEDSIKSTRMQDLEVMDIAELAVEAL